MIGAAYRVRTSVTAKISSPPSTPAMTSDDDALLEFRVYDPTGQVFLGAMSHRGPSSWTEELNNSGSGNLNILLSDPALRQRPEIMRDRNIVRAVFMGVERFAWRVQGGDTTIVDTSENAGKGKSLAGPGGLEILKETVLYPDSPLLPTPEQDEDYDPAQEYVPPAPELAPGEPTNSSSSRYFGYMSKPDVGAYSDPGYKAYTNQIPWYDPSQWHKPAQTRRHRELVSNVPDERNAVWPEAWPDDEARWLWPTNPLLPAQAGDVYFRGIFTLDADESLGVYCSADDGVELFLDGVPIIQSTSGDAYTWTKTLNWEGKLKAGVPHILAAKVTNTPVVPYKARNVRRVGPNSILDLRAFWIDGKVYLRWRGSNLSRYRASTVNSLSVNSPSKTLLFGTATAQHNGINSLVPKGFTTTVVNGHALSTRPNFVKLQLIKDRPNGDDYASTTVVVAVEDEAPVWGFPPKEDQLGGLIVAVLRIKNGVPVKTKPLYYTGILKSHTNGVKAEPWLYYATGVLNPITKQVTTKKRIPGSGGSTSSKTPFVHVVRSGEWMIKIGKKYGMPWQRIYEANKSMIDNDPRISSLPVRPPAWWIFPGMKLKIPGRYVQGASKGTRDRWQSTTTITHTLPKTNLTTEAPGWTPHQILAYLTYEGRARGVSALQAVTIGYGDGKDSAGNYWPLEPEDRMARDWSYGTTLFDITQQMTESGFDVRMTPNLELRAYIRMGVDRGLTSAAPLRIVQIANNVLQYSVSRVSGKVNTMLVGAADGWAEFQQLAGAEERIESSVSVGGITKEHVVAAVGEQLSELAKPLKHVTLKARLTPGLYPYVNFDLGDIVVVPNEMGREFNARITSISIEEAAEDRIQVTIEATGEDRNDR